MKFPLFVILTFYTFLTFSQTENNYQKIEKFIVLNELDSAKHHLKTLKPSSYTNLLNKITTNNNISYDSYYKFTNKISSNTLLNIVEISNYISTKIEEPKNKKAINTTFFNIKWIHICNLRNEGNLDLASKEQRKLENYIAKFNKKDANFTWAKTKLNIHPIVMLLIENKVEEGKKLTLEGIKIAKDLKDIELEIIFSYHLTDFLILENKLQEYIDVSEYCLELEKQLPEKSMFYFSTISHLIDAYIYKGGHNERVLFLMNKLYNSNSKNSTYYLYSQLVGSLSKDNPLQKEILNKFEVNNILELMKKLDSSAKSLNSNEYLKVILNISIALENHKYYIEALDYKDKVVQLTRKIYSEELSENLANYKTEQAVKIKVQEIEIEKEKSNLYAVIIALCAVLLIITFFVIIQFRNQSKKLAAKKNLLEETLKEKELLAKEVHHRVKNNFQLIHSLLELQNEEIEDKKILEVLEKGRNRVKSMALIHQKLYNNEGGLINFSEYFELLINEISMLYNLSEHVHITIESDKIMFDVETAIPLALIINEIITNSYKYAFKNDVKNKLFVSIVKIDEGNYKLIIKDNGPGINEDFDIKTAKSVGLKLVTRLVKQLHGKLHISNNNGAKFEILFKDSKLRQEVI